MVVAVRLFTRLETLLVTVVTVVTVVRVRRPLALLAVLAARVVAAEAEDWFRGVVALHTPMPVAAAEAAPVVAPTPQAGQVVLAAPQLRAATKLPAVLAVLGVLL